MRADVSEHLAFFFYLLSLIAGTLSVGLALGFYTVHRLNAVRWYGLILTSFLSIVLQLAIQSFFRIVGSAPPLVFVAILGILSVGGPTFLMVAFPCFVFVTYTLRVTRARILGLCMVASLCVVLGVVRLVWGVHAIAPRILTPAMFLIVTGSMVLGVIHWRRVASRTLKRALGTFFALTALFGPLIGVELYRAEIPGLRDWDIFELFTTPLYFFLLTTLSVVFSLVYYRRPPYYRGETLTPAFLEEYALTRREAQVIEKLVVGLSYKEIASVLGISARTVDNHLQSAYQKTRVRGRLQLVNLVRSNAAAG